MAAIWQKKINKNTARVTHVESAVHCLAEPDVLAVLALAGPPVLARDARRLGADAGFSCFHVAEDLDGIDGASLVGINPVLSCGSKKKKGLVAVI